MGFSTPSVGGGGGGSDRFAEVAEGTQAIGNSTPVDIALGIPDRSRYLVPLVAVNDPAFGDQVYFVESFNEPPAGCTSRFMRWEPNAGEWFLTMWTSTSTGTTYQYRILEDTGV